MAHATDHTLGNSPVQKARDQSANRALYRSIPGLPAWAITMLLVHLTTNIAAGLPATQPNIPELLSSAVSKIASANNIQVIINYEPSRSVASPTTQPQKQPATREFRTEFNRWKFAIALSLLRPGKLFVDEDNGDHHYFLIDREKTASWWASPMGQGNYRWKSQEPSIDYVLARKEVISLEDVGVLFRSDARAWLKKCENFTEAGWHNGLSDFKFTDTDGRNWQLSIAPNSEIREAIIDYRQTETFAQMQRARPPVTFDLHFSLVFDFWKFNPIDGKTFEPALPKDTRDNQGFDPASPLKVGTLAPDFLLKSLNGNAVHLSDLRENVVLLDCWGSQTGHLVDVNREAVAPAHAKVACFAVDSCGAGIDWDTGYAKSYRLYTGSILLDPGKTFSDGYRSADSCQELIYIVGRDGKIVFGESLNRAPPGSFIAALNAACAQTRISR